MVKTAQNPKQRLSSPPFEMAIPHPSRTAAERWRALLNLLPGEAPLVLPLVAQALLLGLAHVMARIAGNTLFLFHYGAENIPFIYLIGGILAPLGGLLLTRLGRRIRLSYLLTCSLGISLLVLLGFRFIIGQRPVLSESLAGAAGLALFIWVYLQSALLGVGFGALTGRLLDARQNRRWEAC